MTKLVGGVIVAYNPDKSFERVVEAALREVDHLVIVNNGENPIYSILKSDGFVINKSYVAIENSENLGIAIALNLGIKHLINSGCSYFFLLDQDSLVPQGIVSSLRNAFVCLNKDHGNIAAIGPAYFNSRLGKNAPFIQFGKLSIRKLSAEPDTPIVPTHFLISSGTLISLEAITNVGMMEDGLFIDYVDTEWCLRAISKGYKLYGLSTVRMEHSLGDDPVVFLSKKMPMHSPLRHYYIARNALHLIKRSYIPANRRFIVLISMLKTFFFYSLVPRNRLAHFKMMCRGFYDGTLNNYGRYDKLIK